MRMRSLVRRSAGVRGSASLHIALHEACCMLRRTFFLGSMLCLVCCTNRSETVLAALLSPAAATLGVSVLPQRHGLVGTCGFEFLAFAITSAAGELPVCASCMLHVAWRMLHVARCVLMLHAARRMLHAACCMLHVACNAGRLGRCL